MILYSVLTLALFLIENEAKFKKRFDRVPGFSSQDSIHTAAELAKLIHLVNGDRMEEDRVEEDRVNEDGMNEDEAKEDDVNEYDVTGDKGVADSSKQPTDLDYFMIRNVDKNEVSALKKIMALMQSNYDAQKAHEDPRFRIHVISNPRVLEEYKKNVGSRILVINNPEVLEEYKNKIWKKSHKKYDKKFNFKDLRRNAIFRLDSSSIEQSFKSRNNDDFKITKNIPNSSENDQLVYFNKKKSYNDIKKKVAYIKSDENKDNGRNNDYIDDDRKKILKTGREFDDLKEDNAWDIITKKYDWDDNKRTRKNKYNYDSPTYNKKDTVKRFKKENRDIEDNWEKKVTKQEKYDDWETKKTKKENFQDWDQKITKPEKSYNDWPKKEKFIDEPKKKKWDSREKKQDNFEDRDKKITKPNKSYNDWSKKEKVIGKPKTKKWDREKPKKQAKDFDSYENLSKKEVKSFDSYEMPKRDKKSNNDWDITPYKVASFKTTKKRQQESAVDWDKAYAPKIPSYYNNPKPKLRNNYDGGGFFGRTPIPFVGKKGIYVENN